MAGSPPLGDLDAATLHALVLSRGVRMERADAAVALAAVRRARAVMADWATELRADDDIATFRSVLLSEIPR